MRKIGILILSILLLSLSVTLVTAEDYIYYINWTDLPFNYTQNITLTGYENLTLNVSYGDYLTGETFINFSEDFYNLSINVFFTRNVSPVNYTTIVTLNNTDLNFSTEILFYIYLINDTIFPTENYIQTDINEYTYSICDYKIPWNKTHQVTVSGRNGQLIQTDYDSDFFTVLDEFYIPETNYSLVDINIHLKNLTEGEYMSKVKFNVVGDYGNVTFHFHVLDCIAPPPNYDEMIATCGIMNKTHEDILECKRLEAEYALAMYESYQEIDNIKTINNTIIEYVNSTIYEPVFPLNDPSMLTALREFSTMYKQYVSNTRTKDKTILELQLSKNDILNERDQLRKLQNEYVYNATEKLLIETREKDQQILDYEKNYISTGSMWFWIIFLTMSGAIIFTGYRFYEYKIVP